MFGIDNDNGLFQVELGQEAVVLVGKNRCITFGIAKNFLKSSRYYQRLLIGPDVLDELFHSYAKDTNERAHREHRDQSKELFHSYAKDTKWKSLFQLNLSQYHHQCFVRQGVDFAYDGF